MKRLSLAVLALITVIVMLTVIALPAAAAPKSWTLAFDATTIDSAEVATATIVQTQRCSDLFLFLAFEADSATVLVEGSYDQSTWYTLSTFITDGVDGTTAVQFYGPVVRLGAMPAAKATLTEIPLPPMWYTRVKVTNHDKAGDDILSGLVGKLLCNP